MMIIIIFFRRYSATQDILIRICGKPNVALRYGRCRGLRNLARARGIPHKKGERKQRSKCCNRCRRVGMAWEAWRGHLAARSQSQAVLQHAVAVMQNARLAGAFATWRSSAAFSAQRCDTYSERC